MLVDAIVHTLHVILAGVWLGGVVFTTTVVSPALKSVELAEARKEAGASEKAQVLALRRRRLQRLSFWISMLNILISAAIFILAAYARAG